MKYLLLVLLIGIVACSQTGTVPENMPMGQGNMPMGENMPMMHSVESEEEFIVEMIPHHQEAVDTSLLVLGSDNAELQVLAQQIIEAQEAEIAMMNEWLDNWYAGGYEPSYQNMMPDLESLSSDERDVAYIQGMIMHHRMAVMMARQVLALDPREEVAEFAQTVIEVQSSEITQMQEMLEQY